MNKSDLIEALSKETGLPLTKAGEVVNIVFNGMEDTLLKDERVEIRIETPEGRRHSEYEILQGRVVGTERLHKDGNQAYHQGRGGSVQGTLFDWPGYS